MADAITTFLDKLDRYIRHREWTKAATLVERLGEPLKSMAAEHLRGFMPPGKLTTPYQQCAEEGLMTVAQSVDTPRLVSINDSPMFSLEKFRFTPKKNNDFLWVAAMTTYGKTLSPLYPTDGVPIHAAIHKELVGLKDETVEEGAGCWSHVYIRTAHVAAEFLMFQTDAGTIGQHTRFIPELHVPVYAISDEGSNKIWGLNKKQRVTLSNKLRKGYATTLSAQKQRQRWRRK